MTCLNCQLSKNYTERLGHITWEFLETFIEGAPYKIDDIDQYYIKQFITYLSYTYPCIKCRPGFINYVKLNPPIFKTRHEMYIYFIKLKQFINYNK